MTAAYELAKAQTEVEVFEAAGAVGGLARSIELWGQMVDLGPHRFFSDDHRVNRLWLEVVGREYHMVERLTRIYYKKRFYYYPLRPTNALWNMGCGTAARCVASYLKEKATSSCRTDDGASFESWVVGRFGRRLFEMFFKSYSEKLWGVPCCQLDADFAAQRIKKFSLGEAMKSALGFGNGHHKTLVDRFAYPMRGSGMVYDRMARFVQSVGGQVHLGQPVRRVLHANRHVCGVELEDGRRRRFDHVISTMPLPSMVRGLGNLPADVESAVDALTFRNTILVYLLVDGIDLFPDQWLYVHSPELLAGRVTNFRNWVPELYGRARSSILALEYWCYNQDGIWSEPDAELINRAVREIGITGLLRDTPVLDGHVIRIERSYPVYRRGYKDHLARIIPFLNTFRGLTAIGRYGAFKYNNQDHSILMGLLAAGNILCNRKQALWKVNTDYDNYQEAAPIIERRRAA